MAPIEEGLTKESDLRTRCRTRQGLEVRCRGRRLGAANVGVMTIGMIDPASFTVASWVDVDDAVRRRVLRMDDGGGKGSGAVVRSVGVKGPDV